MKEKIHQPQLSKTVISRTPTQLVSQPIIQLVIKTLLKAINSFTSRKDKYLKLNQLLFKNLKFRNSLSRAARWG